MREAEPCVTLTGLPARTAAAYAVLFALAFVAYAWLWPQAPIMEGDSPQYLEVARDLTDFRIDAPHDRTLGYPLLLVLTGSTATPTRTLFYASLLLHFASVWLLGALLYASGVGRRWLLAFCALALLPPYVETAATVMTENLAQFTLAAALGCLVLWHLRRRFLLLFASGVAFAFASLTRPAYQAVTMAVAAALLWAAATRRALRLRDALRAGGVLVAVSAAVLGVVAFRNQARFHYFGITPSIGFHLSTKTMAFVERLPEDYATVREILVRGRDAEITKRGGTHTGTQTIWHVRDQLAAATGLSQPELSRYLLKMNLTLIRRSPLEYLQEVARSLATYWFPAAGPLAAMDSAPLRRLWTGLHAVLVGTFFVQLIAFAGAAIVQERRNPSTAGLIYVLAATIVFYTMLISCVIDIGEPRQRRSTELLFVFMCIAGVHLWRRMKQVPRREASGSR